MLEYFTYDFYKILIGLLNKQNRNICFKDLSLNRSLGRYFILRHDVDFSPEAALKIAEIEHYLTPKPLVSGIVEGDIVELIAGPFKGEKARVQNIDEPKEEITVELFEALVPIPVTVKGDSVRVLEKEK